MRKLILTFFIPSILLAQSHRHLIEEAQNNYKSIAKDSIEFSMSEILKTNKTLNGVNLEAAVKTLTDCKCFLTYKKGLKGLVDIQKNLINITSDEIKFSNEADIAANYMGSDNGKKIGGDLNSIPDDSDTIGTLEKELFLACLPQELVKNDNQKALQYWSTIAAGSGSKEYPRKIAMILLKLFAKDLITTNAGDRWFMGTIWENLFHKRLYRIVDYLRDVESVGLDKSYKVSLDEMVLREDQNFLKYILCQDHKDYESERSFTERYLLELYGTTSCK